MNSSIIQKDHLLCHDKECWYQYCVVIDGNEMSFVDETQGACWLAPLTRGGNLPFRKLCARLGCRASVTEMAFARQLIRKSAKELASIRIHGIDEGPARLGVQRCANTINAPNDYSSYNEIRERRNIVGIQIATKTIDEGLEAIGITRNVDETIKSDFIDINCGCPIYEVAQKRGMGAALLRKPHKLSRLLKGIVDGKSTDYLIDSATTSVHLN